MEAQGAVKYPVLSRIHLPSKNYLAPNVSDAKVEEPDPGVLTLQLTFFGCVECRGASSLRLLPCGAAISYPSKGSRIGGTDPSRRSGPCALQGAPRPLPEQLLIPPSWALHTFRGLVSRGGWWVLVARSCLVGSEQESRASAKTWPAEPFPAVSPAPRGMPPK